MIGEELEVVEKMNLKRDRGKARKRCKWRDGMIYALASLRINQLVTGDYRFDHINLEIRI